ncbi:MAG: hypothetical protein N3D76_10015 [Geminocystis sp.]|nr:hypothetical protein [Geminocystis sp.]HIK36398.1 hypothetical protein [Geminocystis sp. M7585_C2015_104]
MSLCDAANAGILQEMSNTVANSFCCYCLSGIIYDLIHQCFPSANIPSNFSLCLSRDTTSFTYNTPLGNFLPLSSLQEICLFCQQHYNLFHIEATLSNDRWLKFTLHPPVISQWLNTLTSLSAITDYYTPAAIAKATVSRQKQLRFIHYYTHARCCSILRDAHLQQIIALDNLDFRLNQWQLLNPSFIDYTCLDLSNSHEASLVRQIVIICEMIYRQKNFSLAAVDNLGKAILDVECHGRIWGETLRKHKNLSLARLGLFVIGLKFYQFLVYHHYHAQLPSEI